jgi:hypothetical protein
VRRRTEFAAQTFFDHYRISFDEVSRPSAQTGPPCSLQLIEQITDQLPARNLRNFFSPPARTRRL